MGLGSLHTSGRSIPFHKNSVLPALRSAGGVVTHGVPGVLLAGHPHHTHRELQNPQPRGWGTGGHTCSKRVSGLLLLSRIKKAKQIAQPAKGCYSAALISLAGISSKEQRCLYFFPPQCISESTCIWKTDRDEAVCMQTDVPLPQQALIKYLSDILSTLVPRVCQNSVLWERSGGKN